MPHYHTPPAITDLPAAHTPHPTFCTTPYAIRYSYGWSDSIPHTLPPFCPRFWLVLQLLLPHVQVLVYTYLYPTCPYYCHYHLITPFLLGPTRHALRAFVQQVGGTFCSAALYSGSLLLFYSFILLIDPPTYRLRTLPFTVYTHTHACLNPVGSADARLWLLPVVFCLACLPRTPPPTPNYHSSCQRTSCAVTRVGLRRSPGGGLPVPVAPPTPDIPHHITFTRCYPHRFGTVTLVPLTPCLDGLLQPLLLPVTLTFGCHFDYTFALRCTFGSPAVSLALPYSGCQLPVPTVDYLLRPFCTFPTHYTPRPPRYALQLFYFFVWWFVVAAFNAFLAPHTHTTHTPCIPGLLLFCMVAHFGCLFVVTLPHVRTLPPSSVALVP